MSDPLRLRAHPALALVLTIALSTACDAAANTEGEALNEYGNPATVPVRPTAGEITVADLQTRLYAFAHDSMQGRQRGRPGNEKGTDHIAQELARLGLEPAGENGTYFQHLPLIERKYTEASTLVVDGTPLVWEQEWLAVPAGAPPKPFESAQVVYGGIVGDTAQQLAPARAAGKLVVLVRPPTPPAGAPAAGGELEGQEAAGGPGRALLRLAGDVPQPALPGPPPDVRARAEPGAVGVVAGVDGAAAVPRRASRTRRRWRR